MDQVQPLNRTGAYQGEPGGPIAFMASNRVAANLLMPVILAAGMVALESLERQAWPTVPFNTIEVSVACPGAVPGPVGGVSRCRYHGYDRDPDLAGARTDGR